MAEYNPRLSVRIQVECTIQAVPLLRCYRAVGYRRIGAFRDGQNVESAYPYSASPSQRSRTYSTYRDNDAPPAPSCSGFPRNSHPAGKRRWVLVPMLQILAYKTIKSIEGASPAAGIGRAEQIVFAFFLYRKHKRIPASESDPGADIPLLPSWARTS